MDIFRNVSDTISNFIKRHTHADPVNKNDVLDLIDNNLIALRLVTTTYESSQSLLRYIQTELLPANGSNKVNEVLRQIYITYAASLSGVARQQENIGLLRSIYAAAKILLVDHETMRANFDLLFKDGTDVGEISLEQMKLSHATIFGFINLSSLLSDWFCFFLGQLDGQPGSSERKVAYRETVVRDSGNTVADFVNDVLMRGPNRGILSIVQSIRSTGDVAIYTSAATLNSYANINDYPGIKQFMGSFSSFQPILLLREFISSFVRAKYKRNLAMREWVQAKLIVLQMDADRMDPQSPEYLRQKQILQRYSDELAKLDAKINHYEQS